MTIHRPELADPDPGGLSGRMMAGLEINELARQLFPQGKVAWQYGMSNKDAIAETRRLMDDGVEVIFEATVATEQFLVRSDILRREGDSWHLLEVKASANANKAKYKLDAAFQAYVLRLAGLNVASASIVHLTKEYVWDGGPLQVEALFRTTALPNDPMEVLTVPPEGLATLQGLTEYPSREGQWPHVDPGLRAYCRDCRFNGHCSSRAPKDHILNVGLHHSRVDRLRTMGIERASEIPANFAIPPKERLRFDALMTGRPQVTQELRARLDEIQYPAHCIDFETTMPVLPVFAGMKPFQQLAFQWSCHTVASKAELLSRRLTADVGHTEFLHQERSDPRAEFCRTLWEQVREGGTILHYHSFEREVIAKLADAGVPFADELMSIPDERFIDLRKIVEDCFAHPDFKGRTSIKVVLPVVAPDLSYDALDVHNGDEAQELYAFTLTPEATDEQRAQIYRGLLAYCKLDTWAMVRILQTLQRRVDPGSDLRPSGQMELF